MGGNKESDQENNGNKKGLQLDPGFVPIEGEDDLDCSRARQDKNLELWLLQIPVDFPLDEKVVWRATEPGSDRLSAICEIEDAGYRLVEEQETGQAPVYAIGGGDNVQPTKITRRVNVVKRTDAQKVCFGVEDTDVLEEVDAGPASPAPVAAATMTATPSKDKSAKKEKKKDKKKKREENNDEPDTEQKKKKSKKK